MTTENPEPILYDTTMLLADRKYKDISFFTIPRGLKLEDGVTKTFDHTNMETPNIVSGIRYALVTSIQLKFDITIVDMTGALDGSGILMVNFNGFNKKKCEVSREQAILRLPIKRFLDTYSTGVPIKLGVFDVFQFDVEWSEEVQPIVDTMVRLELFGSMHVIDIGASQ